MAVTPQKINVRKKYNNEMINKMLKIMWYQSQLNTFQNTTEIHEKPSYNFFRVFDENTEIVAILKEYV